MSHDLTETQHRGTLRAVSSSTSTSVTAVASSNAVFWNAAKGLPKAVRPVVHSTVQPSPARADDSARMAR